MIDNRYVPFALCGKCSDFYKNHKEEDGACQFVLAEIVYPEDASGKPAGYTQINIMVSSPAELPPIFEKIKDLDLDQPAQSAKPPPSCVHEHTPGTPCSCAHCGKVSETGPNYIAGWGVMKGSYHCPDGACFLALASGSSAAGRN